MSATNRNGLTRHAGDFYETPASAIDPILKEIGITAEFTGYVIDAGAGTGATHVSGAKVVGMGKLETQGTAAGTAITTQSINALSVSGIVGFTSSTSLSSLVEKVNAIAALLATLGLTAACLWMFTSGLLNLLGLPVDAKVQLIAIASIVFLTGANILGARVGTAVSGVTTMVKCAALVAIKRVNRRTYRAQHARAVANLMRG